MNTLSYVYKPVSSAENLFDAALNPQLDESLKAVLLYTFIEKIAADVIVASGERKLRKLLCKLSSKKRIWRALAILRRNGFLSEDEYKELRKAFRALRCLRNTFLHPVCGENCPAIEFNEIVKQVKIFSEKAKQFIESMTRSWGESINP